MTSYFSDLSYYAVKHSLVVFLFGELPDGKLHIPAELLGTGKYAHLLDLLRRVGEVFGFRHLRGIDGGLHAAQSDPHLLVRPCGIVALVDGEYLSPFLVRQP